MATDTDALRAGLNLTRRLPPKEVATTLQGLALLRPELTDEFLQRIDTPLQVRVCPSTKRRYIPCEYSRDGDAYRSPWSNTYDPPLEDGIVPPEHLRTMEVAANELLDIYRELYYGEGGGASCTSAYFWESGTKGFAACWLVHKDLHQQQQQQQLGTTTAATTLTAGASASNKGSSWDAIHVLDVSPSTTAGGGGETNPHYTYKITTTILLSLAVDKPTSHGALELAGTLTRQASATFPVSAEKGHVQNMGSIVEAMEGEIRGALDAQYISKTREVVGALRPRGNQGVAAVVAGGGSSRGGGGALGGGGASGGGGGALVNDLAAALQRRNNASSSSSASP